MGREGSPRGIGDGNGMLVSCIFMNIDEASMLGTSKA